MIRIATAMALIAIVLAAGFAFAAGQAEGEAMETQEWRLATNHVEGTPPSLGYELFAERVEELTDGAITVEIFYSSVLGDSREVMEQTQAGAIELTHISAGFLAAFVPMVDVFGVPYLFRSQDHFWNVLNGDVGETLEQEIEDDAGVKLLVWVESGARSFYNKVRPIYGPEDVEGLRIRVMGSPVMIQTMEVLGATPTTTAFAEVYNALQTGVIDGAENNPISVSSMKHDEVVDYYSLDEHMRIPDMLLMNIDVFESLSPDMQDAVLQAAQDAEEFIIEEWGRQEAERLEMIADTGVEINEIPDKSEFIEATEGLRAELAPKFGDLFERIQAVDG